MAEKRGQGRPGRDAQEVGRDRLVEMVRVAMHPRPKIDIQRREIADVAGVTPALVSYYFPDKWTLLEAAARPIIEMHVDRVREMLRSTMSPVDKIKQLIRLYIVFNREHGHLLDYYLASIDKKSAGESLEFLAKVHGEIIDFLRTAVDERCLRDTNAEVLHSIIWSICQYVAQLPQNRQETLFPNAKESDVIDQQAGIICSLLINGLLLEARLFIPT